MFSFKNHIFVISLITFIILNSCKLQDPSNSHGIVFLKNRSEKLVINNSNKNDVIDIIGQPHTKSINNSNEWMYIERILTKGSFHKLGQNVLKENNVLILNFDKYGILISKKLLNLNDKKNVNFSEMKTNNELSQKSFVEKFLNSMRTRMYGNRKKN